jgi:hypothetical protein
MRLFFGLLLFVCAASTTSTRAWEANYPSGPVRQPGKAAIKLHIAQQPRLPDLKALTNNPSLTGPDASTVGTLFSRRRVAYPTPDGVSLGHGWDFLSNEKKFLTCVEFKEIRDDKYQTVDSRLQQTIDEETLDISLNAQFSGSVGGSIEIVDAKAEATSTLKASHHLSSSDTVFIVHESATNGVIYTGPTGSGLNLRPTFAKLATTDPVAFREKCGDGFIASIGLGADLYVMLHAHDLTTEDKVELEFASKASAGIADVFNASGTSTLSTKIDDLLKKKRLDIEFVQQGGIFVSVPTNLADAIAKVQTFMGEEKAGPRSTFVTLVPYSDLPNWPGVYMLDTSDIRQRAIRYSQRLASVLYETLNIRENYFREDGLKGDRYLFDYAHQLRKDDLNKTADDVRQELKDLKSLLETLDGPSCKAPPASSDPLSGGQEANRVVLLRKLGETQRDCEIKIAGPLTKMHHFDDFRFWITLPIPLDGISEKDARLVTDLSGKTPIGDRQKIFEQNLFRYWVERTDQLRCRLFFECLTAQEKKDQYSAIVTTVPTNPPTFTGITATPFLICYGELDYDQFSAPFACRSPSPRRRFDCDHANFEVDAHQICQVENDAFRYSISAYNTRGGNRCGYTDGTVTCYSNSPTFP